MWLVDELNARSLPDTRWHELVSDGVQLCDGIELVAWGGDPIHLFHCDHCGGDDRQGGWVSARRCDEWVLWLPALASFGDDAWAREELAPPSFLRTRGIPMFQHATLAAQIANVPALDAIAPLTRRDLARVLQFESDGLLGSLFEPPRVRRSWLISATEASLDDAVDRFEELLAQWLRSDDEVSLAPTSDEAAVCFWAEPGDRAGREWRPLARHAGLLLPRFEPGLVAVPRTLT